MSANAEASEVLEAIETQTKERAMNPVVEMQRAPVVQSRALATTATPADLLRIALEGGADIEKLEHLMALQERYEANEARKAFVQAMAEFKKNPPEIFKRKNVSFGDTSYMHATLGDVTAITVAALARCGFSHRWDIDQPDGQITVKCVLTHALGHSEATTLKAGADQSGKKNSIQAVASTVTYLQRYTLLSSCGLATQDMPDDDGIGDSDTTLRDEWIANANKALTLDVLNQTWNLGVAAINEAGDKPSYDAFKAAVAAKKKELS